MVEVGPGLGSLTLGLLDVGRAAWSRSRSTRCWPRALPDTVAARRPDLAAAARPSWRRTRSASPSCPARRRRRWWPTCPTTSPCRCCCTCWSGARPCATVLVMVQAEVADRLAAGAGQPHLRRPVGEGRLVRRGHPGRRRRPVGVLAGAERRLRRSCGCVRRDAAVDDGRPREEVFAVVDAAFAQRRKTLRAALAGWAGCPAAAEAALRAAGVDPQAPRRDAARSSEFARDRGARPARR